MKKIVNRGLKVMFGIGKFVASQSCEFWKNIGCLLSEPTFGLGGSRLWEKEEEQKLSGKKRKQRSIRAKVDLY